MAPFVAVDAEARVQAERGLCGHPDSGTEWEHHCDEPLKNSGFINVGEGAWPSYPHKRLGLWLSVCVDGFKLAGPSEAMGRGGGSSHRDLSWAHPQPSNL